MENEMSEMTLEQVRDQLREWGEVDHSPLCVNCVFWADAIDAALQSRRLRILRRR
jgi:hypothetical protein